MPKKKCTVLATEETPSSGLYNLVGCPAGHLLAPPIGLKELKGSLGARRKLNCHTLPSCCTRLLSCCRRSLDTLFVWLNTLIFSLLGFDGFQSLDWQH